MLGDWGMLASQYRGFIGAIRLKLALAHDMPFPPPSVFETLFLREMASGPLPTETVIQDHPRESGITTVVRICQPQSHGKAKGGGTSMQSPLLTREKPRHVALEETRNKGWELKRYWTVLAPYSTWMKEAA